MQSATANENKIHFSSHIFVLAEKVWKNVEILGSFETSLKWCFESLWCQPFRDGKKIVETKKDSGIEIGHIC